ncbi:heavy metal translocating P-type ATPase [Acinetobacter larvae]|uniref:heavy metal translocating P-type ATPase n=1 Tax=Acinetobacter larvae TaxID=1789224 RepID=UPI000AB6AB75|nr:heavy metal translocating P-type ATPase [Acinetobacter larvae]
MSKDFNNKDQQSELHDVQDTCCRVDHVVDPQSARAEQKLGDTQSSACSHQSKPVVDATAQEHSSGCGCSGEATVPKQSSCCSGESTVPKQSSCCSGGQSQTHNDHTQGASALTALAVATQHGDYLRSQLRIMQMDCPTEEAMIRKKLGHMSSVQSLEFNLMQRVLTVVHEPAAMPEIIAAIQSLGFDAESANAAGQFEQNSEAKTKPLWPLAIAGIFALLAEIGDWLQWSVWITLLVSLIAIGLSGIETYKKGLIAVKNLNLNINALMSIAVTGAFLIGSWPEAAMVMVLFSAAELIEARSLARARNAIGELMQLAPDRVTVQQPDGQWLARDADQVAIHDIVRVKPGEKIGLDGVIVKGQSSIDQSPITGESIPIDKVEGDSVFAGTINTTTAFEYRVTAAANDTTLARIIHAVEEAQGEKAPTQRFVDQFARVYTPLVFLGALLIAIVPPLIFGAAWLDWIYKALVILVIACPCALVISTPVTVVSGLAAAARRGILIKGGVYLEQGRLLKYLAFDKTGTITYGKPQQTDFQVLHGKPDDIQQLLVSLAHHSDHPVSQAIVQAAADDLKLLDVDDFTALLGRGTRGVMNGVTYWLGNHRLIHELDYCSPELEQQIATLEKAAKTVVLFAKDQQVLALVAVADTVKESSRKAISALATLGVSTMMLSGDNSHTVEVIAQQVGIDQAKGNLLPEDKLNLVASYAETSHIGMVGDGINDAPALARANIGFAMGSMGTDVAIETADVAIMDDDLGKIPDFIALSHKTHRILVENISLALITKFVFLALTLWGLGSMWMAVFADVGVSLIVVANGLRLLSKAK